MFSKPIKERANWCEHHEDRTNKGVIFCHVAKVARDGQEIEVATWGSQKCRGAPPSFKSRDRKIMAGERVEPERFVATASRNSADPKAWAMKYFTEASDELFLESLEIRGRKDIMFNSNLAQTTIGFDADRAIIVLSINVQLKRVRNGGENFMV